MNISDCDCFCPTKNCIFTKLTYGGEKDSLHVFRALTCEKNKAIFIILVCLFLQLVFAYCLFFVILLKYMKVIVTGFILILKFLKSGKMSWNTRVYPKISGILFYIGIWNNQIGQLKCQIFKPYVTKYVSHS